jgi:outer membrane protein assembly factor BamB
MTSCPCLARAARLGALLLALGVLAGAGLAFSQDRPPVAAKAGGAPDAPKPTAGKSDAPTFGGGPGRNMVNLIDKGIPDKPDPKDADLVKWKADLGSRAYGGPVVANGKVIVGTNNERPRNARDVKKGPDGDEPIDKGVVMCFDEATGKFVWQAVHDKLPDRNVKDWPKEGVCATPLIDGDKVYYTSNRCTLVCLDLNGQKKGLKALVCTDDPMKKGVVYDTPTDAGVVWELDMIKDLGVFPHNMTAANPLMVGDILFVSTANGVDENHINIPAPQAPSFIAVDKNTGKVLWKKSDPGKNIMHGQWSNPAYADVGGVKQVIFPGGDGWLYAYDPPTGNLLWKFDANPKAAVYELGGTGDKSDFIGTPVIAGDKLYIGTGQDPEHFTGIAYFYCLDLAKAAANAKKNKDQDVSPELVDKVTKGDDGKDKVTGKANPDSAVAWVYGGKDDRKFVPRDFKFGRTMSSACVVDDVVYIAELSGYLHCLDAKTGKKFWQYDLKGAIWGSPYYVDGKVFLATEGSDLFVFKHSKTPNAIDELDNPAAADQKSFNNLMKAKKKQVEADNLLAKIEFDAAIRSTPIVANGVLYVMTENTLYAFKSKK